MDTPALIRVIIKNTASLVIIVRQKRQTKTITNERNISRFNDKKLVFVHIKRDVEWIVTFVTYSFYSVGHYTFYNETRYAIINV